MKTIKKGSEYKRVSDSEAELLVKIKQYSYCSKQEWKKNVRDIGKPSPETQPANTPEKVEKKKQEKKQEDYKKSKKDKKDKK